MIFSISAYGEVEREEEKRSVNRLLDVQIDDSKARNVNRIYTGKVLENKEDDLENTQNKNARLDYNFDNKHFDNKNEANIIYKSQASDINFDGANVKFNNITTASNIELVAFKVDLGNSKNIDIKNLDVEMNNGQMLKKFRGISLVSTEADQVNIDGVKVTLDSSKATNMMPKESAVYGVHSSTNNGNENIKNVEVNVNNGSTITGSLTGLLAGKYDETVINGFSDAYKNTTIRRY